VTATAQRQDGMQNQGNILLHSGAQISLIQNESTPLLGLKGKNSSITITQVGGDEETKDYKKSVCTSDSGQTYRVSSTLGVQKYRNIGLNNLKI